MVIDEAPSGTRQGAAHRPQDRDEGRGADQRQEQADAAVDQDLGCPAGVVRDAVFGVGGFGAGQPQVIEALAVEPAVDQLPGHPFAPAHLQGLTRAHDADADRGHGGDDQAEGEHGAPERRGVLGGQRVEEPLVPVVHGERGADAEGQECDEGERDRPGAPAAVAAPEAAREPRERHQHPAIERQGGGIRWDRAGGGHLANRIPTWL